MMNTNSHTTRHPYKLATVLGLIALLAACASNTPRPTSPAATTSPPLIVIPTPLPAEPPPVKIVSASPPPRVIVATPVEPVINVRKAVARNDAEYKREMAQHIYATHVAKLHLGKLMPNLPAIGIVELTINESGQVAQLNWRRKPADLDFVPVTERLIYAAQPYPAPAYAKQATFSEVWLWTPAQRFQLDSLTEGQR